MNSNGWFLDYAFSVDEVPSADLLWTARQIVDDPGDATAMIEFDASLKEDKSAEDAHSKKRSRGESCAGAGTKACREKMRRDRLNERFLELSSILNPGKPPKGDKVAILSDATRLLNQLRGEAEKLKESNEALQDAIKNLKAEKSELKEEKVRLKAEKERIEQLLKGSNLASPLVPHPAAVASFHATALNTCNKTIPYATYLPTGLWQWIPPAALDTSQDHVHRPPVA